MTLLEVDALESGYGKLPVLHGVSLRIAEGEIVAVVGPNGAGKTTLMKTIFRLLPTRRGTIRFGEHELSAIPATRLAALGLGYVPQDANTFADLSVEDNLRVSLAGRGRAQADEAIGRMYETFPLLRQRRRQRAKTLSGGERQMLALAGAMATAPRFLALDEPTTGLAPTIVQALTEQILAFRDAGTTVLWVVEENPLQVLRHVDRVYVLDSGIMHREVAAAELLADHSLQELFFGARSGGAEAAGRT